MELFKPFFFTPFNISNADFHDIKKKKKCKNLISILNFGISNSYFYANLNLQRLKRCKLHKYIKK